MTKSISSGTGGTGVSYSATHEGLPKEGVKEEQNRERNRKPLCHPCHHPLNGFYGASYAARHSEETRAIPTLEGITHPIHVLISLGFKPVWLTILALVPASAGKEEVLREVAPV